LGTSIIEISQSAILNNYSLLQNLASEAMFCPVIKSNGYGHGISQMASILEKAAKKPEFLGVHSLEEGRILRRGGFSGRVVVLGYSPLSQLTEAAKLDLSISVTGLEYLKKLINKNLKLSVHLKLESGTNRQGILFEDLAEVGPILNINPQLIIEGAYTHFADIEDTISHEFAKAQIKKFGLAVEFLRQNEVNPQIIHSACSAALLLFPETHMDLVRVGISLYGYWPSKETLISFRERNPKILDLKPGLTWKTKIGQIKTVQAGETVGYGRSFRVNMPMKIAVIPVGYFDGYDRSMSGQAHVLIGGQRAPVVGRICMNMIMVSITHIPETRLEGEVVLLGRQGDEEITADELANWSDTIHYEFLSRINPAIERVVV